MTIIPTYSLVLILRFDILKIYISICLFLIFNKMVILTLKVNRRHLWMDGVLNFKTKITINKIVEKVVFKCVLVNLNTTK